MQRQHLMVLGALLTGCLAGHAADVTGTRYPCFQAPSEPTIDGKVVGDPAWQAIPAVTGFRLLGGGYTHVKQSTARMCWTAAAVFIAVECEEPDAAKLKPTAKDGGWTWSEDSVEIFLQPENGGQVYQIGVTAGGAMGSGEGSPEIGKCTAAATLQAATYTLEIRIPFTVLRTPPAPAGTTWRGTFCRNIQTVTPSGGDKFTCWSPLQSRFLEPGNFAVITFAERPSNPEEGNRLSAELNQGYRAELASLLQGAARRATDFREALQGAVSHPRLGRKAQELLSAWQRIEALSSQAATAPLPDLRQALLTAQGLQAASYETKYTALLEKLLAEP
jgi:hypothetical protein